MSRLAGAAEAEVQAAAEAKARANTKELKKTRPAFHQVVARSNDR